MGENQRKAGREASCRSGVDCHVWQRSRPCRDQWSPACFGTDQV